MKFAHQSATIRQHGKGMIILETALETAGLTYVFPDGNGIKNIAFQEKSMHCMAAITPGNLYCCKPL
jgi:ABC-2 type transport system ATP-binding protein